MQSLKKFVLIVFGAIGVIILACLVIAIIAWIRLPESSTIVQATPNATEVFKNAMKTAQASMPTSTPQVNAVRNYQVAVKAKLSTCYVGLQILLAQSNKASTKAGLLVDPDWQEETARGLALMNKSCTTFSEIKDVPDSCRSVQNNFVQAEKEYGNVITYMTQAMKDSDANKVGFASDSMGNAVSYQKLAIDELNSLSR